MNVLNRLIVSRQPPNFTYPGLAVPMDDDNQKEKGSSHDRPKVCKRQRLEPIEENEFACCSKPNEKIEHVFEVLRNKLAIKMTSGSNDQRQLSKFILAILENRSLTNDQKMSTVRCLTDSVARLSASKLDPNS